MCAVSGKVIEGESLQTESRTERRKKLEDPDVFIGDDG